MGTLALLAALFWTLGGSAQAATEASAVVTVVVEVQPMVSVQAMASTIDLGLVRSGSLDATAAFRVHSNVESVAVYACATDMHRDGRADANAIPLEDEVDIQTQGSGDSGQNAGFVGAGPDMDGLPSRRTATLALESGGGIFDQDVVANFRWSQPDADRHRGRYMARIKLAAMTLDDNQTP